MRAIELPTHSDTILAGMAEVRKSEPTHALLISESGLIGCLPVNGQDKIVEELPLDGFYLGGIRLLSGWDVEFGTTSGIGEKRTTGEIYPDHIRRFLENGGSETITLDPEAAAFLVEIQSPRKEAIRFTANFDLRPIGISYMENPSRYDSDSGILIHGSPGTGFIAIVSKATWIASAKIERVEYPDRYPPLDEIATLTIPGHLDFPATPSVIVAIGAALTEESAVSLALKAFKESHKLKERAKDRAISFLNQAPLLSESSQVTAIAAWDRWLLGNHKFRDAYTNHFLPLPPIGVKRDLIVSSRAIPAWYWISNGDTSFNILFRSFLEASDKSQESAVGFEEQLYLLNSLIDWIELSGDEPFLEQYMDRLADLLEKVTNETRFNKNRVPISQPSRWQSRLEELALPSPYIESPIELTLLLQNTVQRANSVGGRIKAWSSVFREVNTPLKAIKTSSLIPYDPIIQTDPFVWSEEERLAWDNTLNNLEFNAGFVETVLMSDREDKTDLYLGRIAEKLWGSSIGLRFHHLPEYNVIAFPQAAWVTRAAMVQETGEIRKEFVDFYLRPCYSNWCKTERDASSILYPGASPEATETIAERIRFLYENILGIDPDHKDNRLRIAPCGPKSFWQNRKIETMVRLGDEKLSVLIDPYNGVYRVTRPGKIGIKLLDIEDLNIGGVSLQTTVQIKKRGITEITRILNAKDEPTLALDGVELGDVQRKLKR